MTAFIWAFIVLFTHIGTWTITLFIVILLNSEPPRIRANHPRAEEITTGDVLLSASVGFFMTGSRFSYAVYEVWSWFRSLEKPFEEWVKTVQGESHTLARRTYRLEIGMIATRIPCRLLTILILVCYFLTLVIPDMFIQLNLLGFLMELIIRFVLRLVRHLSSVFRTSSWSSTLVDFPIVRYLRGRRPFTQRIDQSGDTIRLEDIISPSVPIDEEEYDLPLTSQTTTPQRAAAGAREASQNWGPELPSIWKWIWGGSRQHRRAKLMSSGEAEFDILLGREDAYADELE